MTEMIVVKNAKTVVLMNASRKFSSLEQVRVVVEPEELVGRLDRAAHRKKLISSAWAVGTTRR